MMKNILIILACAIGFVSCEKQIIDLLGKYGGNVTTEEVTFRDMGMCSGLWFEKDCGDVLEVYNYFPEDMGFCGTSFILNRVNV